MRTPAIAFAVALVIASSGVTTAWAASVKQQAQQQKMKDCNAQADTQGLKGAGKGKDRQAFMKTCLGGANAAAPVATAKATQQEKMKQCNKDATAKSLKGADRQKFMSTCLSTSPAN